MIKRKEPLLVQAGLVLGLLALGNLVGDVSQFLRYLLASLALLFFLHLVMGMLTYTKQVKEQLGQALVASVFPTFFMQGMVASTYLASWTFLGNFVRISAQVLWWMSFGGLVFLMVYYILAFVFPFKWENVFPAWTVLFVGIGVAPLTIAVPQQLFFGQLVFWYGLLATLLVLPIVLYKTYKIGLVENVRPNTTTICAPISLMTAAYVATFSQPNPVLLSLLLISGQCFYAFILWQLPRLIKRPFSAGFSAFTFPLVISAVALKQSLNALNLGLAGQILLTFEVLIALLVVLYITFLYAKDILGK